MQPSIVYALGKKLGLTKKDIDAALGNIPSIHEQPILSSGPPFYHGGGRYGTFSNHVFEQG